MTPCTRPPLVQMGWGSPPLWYRGVGGPPSGTAPGVGPGFSESLQKNMKSAPRSLNKLENLIFELFWGCFGRFWGFGGVKSVPVHPPGGGDPPPLVGGGGEADEPFYNLLSARRNGCARALRFGTELAPGDCYWHSTGSRRYSASRYPPLFE